MTQTFRLIGNRSKLKLAPVGVLWVSRPLSASVPTEKSGRYVRGPRGLRQLASAAELVDMPQQVRRVLVDTQRRGLLQLALAVAAAEQPDAERPAARGGEHVPDRVADDIGRFDRRAEARGRREKQIGIGLGVRNLIAR